MECLQRFHFKWSYRPGRLNVADPISRRPYTDDSPADPSAAFVGAITREKHSSAAQQAAARSPGNDRPVLIDQATVSSFQKGYQVDAVVQSLVHSGALSSAHGLLWHGDALVIPAHESLREDIMYNMHDSSIAGHPGIRRTKYLMRMEYWWLAMDTASQAEIEAYVQTCATCQHDKARTPSATVPLQPLKIPCRPWQSVSMDLITALPKTRSGNTAIIVCICRLTKMMHAVATVTECSAADVAFPFLNTVFKLHGAPQELVSDRDTRFTSAFRTEVCQLMQTKHSMILTQCWHSGSPVSAKGNSLSSG